MKDLVTSSGEIAKRNQWNIPLLRLHFQEDKKAYNGSVKSDVLDLINSI